MLYSVQCTMYIAQSLVCKISQLAHHLGSVPSKQVQELKLDSFLIHVLYDFQIIRVLFTA